MHRDNNNQIEEETNSYHFKDYTLLSPCISPETSLIFTDTTHKMSLQTYWSQNKKKHRISSHKMCIQDTSI